MLGLGLIQVNVRVRDNVQLLRLDYKGQLQLDEMEDWYRPGISTAPGEEGKGGRVAGCITMLCVQGC